MQQKFHNENDIFFYRPKTQSRKVFFINLLNLQNLREKGLATLRAKKSAQQKRKSLRISAHKLRESLRHNSQKFHAKNIEN